MAKLAPGRDLDAQKNLFDELSLVGDVDLMDYGADIAPSRQPWVAWPRIPAPKSTGSLPPKVV